MTIRAKISMLAAALLVLLAIVGGVAVDGLWRVHGELKNLHLHVLPLEAMVEDLAQQEIKRDAELYASLTVDGGPGRIDHADMPTLLNAEAETVTTMLADIAQHQEKVDHPEITALIKQPTERLLAVGAAFARSARALATAMGDGDRAATDTRAETFMTEGMKLHAVLEELTHTMRAVAIGAARRAEEHETRVEHAVIATTLIALVIGVFGAIIVSGLITRPVRRLVGAAMRVEQGDLDTEVTVSGHDEISRLSRTFNAMVEGLRVKDQIKDTFGKYIDPRVVDHLIGETALLDSTRRAMTVSLSQYAGFSEFAEEREPEQIVDRINAYYTAMADEIAEGNGVVDKMMGDTVLAFFGPPFTPEASQAELACLAALRQMRWRPDGSPPEHRPRIGIASEESIVGTMGSEKIRSFTIMGDNVVVAEAIVQACGIYDVAVLIGGNTRRRIGEGLITRHIDNVLLRGRALPLELHELWGTRDDISDDDLAFKDAYETALRTYMGRAFDEARELFEACAERRPDDEPTAIMLDRLNLIDMDPPDDEWSGAWPLSRS